MPTQEQIRTCFILCYRHTKMYLPVYLISVYRRTKDIVIIPILYVNFYWIKQSHFASQVYQLFEVHKINDVVGTVNVNPPFFMQLFHDFSGFFNTNFCHLC